MVGLAYMGSVATVVIWLLFLALGWFDAITGAVSALLIISLAVQARRLARAAEADQL